MPREPSEPVGVAYWDLMGGFSIDGFVSVEWDRSYALTNGRVSTGPRRDFLLIEVLDHFGHPDGWLAITNGEVTSMDRLSESDPIVAHSRTFKREATVVDGETRSMNDLLRILESSSPMVTVYTKRSGTELPLTGEVEVHGNTCVLQDQSEEATVVGRIAIADVLAVEWGTRASQGKGYSWGDAVSFERIGWDRGHAEFAGVSIWPVDRDGFSAWGKVDSDGRYDGLVWLLDDEISSRVATHCKLVGPAPPWSDHIVASSSIRTFLDAAITTDTLVAIFLVRTGAQELLVGRPQSVIEDHLRFTPVTPEGKLDSEYSVVAIQSVLAIEADSQYLRMLDHVRKAN